jgi:serine phosphatase RsbU (regulator of sigma subunit)/predicted enzyme related to lactoylglutathione lyase
MGSSSQPPLDQILRIHCVKVFVRDQELSLRFYLDRLGFRLVADTVLQSGERWLAVAPPDGEAVIALIAPEPDSKQYGLIGRHTDVVFVTDDVIAKYREWSSRGVKFFSVPKLRRIKSASGKPMLNGRESTVWGGVFTSFKDIDGNSFSLVSFDEVTRAIEAQRRAVAEKAEAERRVAQELEIAKRVQARLFPQHLPTLRTLDYAGSCLQALQVGGDYYDFLALGRERLGLVIGDISGKGIAAALLMANLQANLRSQCAMAIDEPERLLRSINRLFCENTPDGAYATFFFSEYDDQAGRLRYANCGHLAALLLRSDDRVERLGSTATVLGLFKDWECSVGETMLFAGDTLALYTDGVTEASDGNGEEFGEERLVDCLQRHRHLPSHMRVEAVIEDVRRYSPHEQQDDITLIVAKCHSRVAQNQLGLPYDGGL